MASLHDFRLKDLHGQEVSLSKYAGKVVLLENVASLWGTTVVDFESMNEIASIDSTKVSVVGVFCNQFGFQTNEGPAETLKILRDVRPGNGFQPKMDLYAKVNVNGAHADPLFKWMRNTIKIPMDSPGDTKDNGCDDTDIIISPRTAFDSVTISAWSPVTRSDIAWNFEKFLFDKSGALVKRYSRYYKTSEIEKDIRKLM